MFLPTTNYQLHTESGFTLLELLVSVSILIIITAIALANFRTGEKMERLRFAVEDVQQQVRVMQTAARTGQRFFGQVSTGGYGIVLTPCAAPPCTLRLFADVNNDHRATANEYLQNTVALTEHVAIPDIRVDGANVSAYTLIAQSPFGDLLAVDANGVPLTAREIRFQFKHLDLNRTRTLILNVQSGQMRQE